VTTVRGIDVSGNNSRQDWKTQVKAGVRFAFVKASEGNHTRDPLFSVHVSDVKAAKIPVLGGYHFAWLNEPATMNAANFIAAVRPHVRPGFVLVLDLEPYWDDRNWKGTTAVSRKAWVLDWLTAVHRAYRSAALLVYAGGDYDDLVPAGLRVDGRTVPVARWYPRYPWADPTWAKAESAGRPSRDGRAVAFWQFCGADLDRSLWYGTLAQLEAWAAGGSSSPSPSPSKPKPKAPAARPRQVTVKAGMTLSGIAIVLGSSVTALAHYNHIKDPDLIYPGQVISAPPVAPSKPKPRTKPKPKAPAYTVHVVRAGDTLWAIARAAHTSTSALAHYNHLKNPDLIYPGQKIRIPKGK
jgi:LysM repeat protein/GH25 family lysozyme M1 (1,4-beta-N-acetylmuramidase)